MKGIAALPVILVIVVILALFLAAGSFFRKSNPPKEKFDDGYGISKSFFNKDGVSLTHSWPGEGNFSNEETEILLFNESSSNVEVKSFDLAYIVEGKTYPHKSGTWEKFPSKESWDKIEYINISQSYYQGQSLVLASGEKGKLHWHIQFGPNPLDGKQSIKVNLILVKDGQSININEEFNRDSGTVFNKEDH
ncbi:hypothetical protein HYW87_01370 [Candidatus Roizmanbacteria bacterium]|nr:hypothetical protein [Candidatus Roizmanbacteria bacterium]